MLTPTQDSPDTAQAALEPVPSPTVLRSPLPVVVSPAHAMPAGLREPAVSPVGPAMPLYAAPAVPPPELHPAPVMLLPAPPPPPPPRPGYATLPGGFFPPPPALHLFPSVLLRPAPMPPAPPPPQDPQQGSRGLPRPHNR